MNHPTNQPKKHSLRSVLPKTALFVALALLAIVALLLAGRLLSARRQTGDEIRGDLSGRFTAGPSVTYQGRTYTPKKKLLNILFIGTDHPSTDAAHAGGANRNGGQADFLLLLSIDSEAKTITQLHIDRDTIADITTLGVLGNISGTRPAQICLSYAFGDGREQSCELTVQAVERLLYGVAIDFYVAISFDAIAVLNDAVGGVTVEIADDFSAYDASMKAGTTMRLQGQQAEYFVRGRYSIGDGSNVLRMNRQRAYMSAFMDTLAQSTRENAGFIGSVYDAAGSKLISNMKRGRIINEANKALPYDAGEVLSIQGTHSVDTEGFVEFVADPDALQALVLDLFYDEVTP